MRFAALLCYSVQCLYVFLYGFAVFVPPSRLMPPPPPPQVAMDVITGQCKMQIADYCLHSANENVTTTVPLFSNPPKKIVRCQSAVFIFHCPIGNRGNRAKD